MTIAINKGKVGDNIGIIRKMSDKQIANNEMPATINCQRNLTDKPADVFNILISYKPEWECQQKCVNSHESGIIIGIVRTNEGTNQQGSNLWLLQTIY